MTGNSIGRRFRANILSLGTALVFLFLGAPICTADPWAVLPEKEAKAAREALAALDSSLAGWEAIQIAFSESVQKSRSSVAGARDSSACKALLEAGAQGTWRRGKGPTISAAEDLVRSRAKRLAGLLEPRIGSLGETASGAMFSALSERVARLPGASSEYLDFASRLSKNDARGSRFALRAALAVLPDEMAARLAPDAGDPSALPYASDPDLRARARRISDLRAAKKAIESSAPALAVPELPWTREETQGAEKAAALLASLEPSLRKYVMEPGRCFPGVEILPAFLSGLSPEDRTRWRFDRGLSVEAVRTFLSATGGAREVLADSPGSGLALAEELAELERDAQGGLAGLEFLARLTDPALRYTLRDDLAPEGLKTMYVLASADLSAALEARLNAAAGGSAGSGEGSGRFHVEVRDVPGPGGFQAFSAYSSPTAGGRTAISAKALARELESVLPGPASEPGRASKALRLGILVSENASEDFLIGVSLEGSAGPTFSAIAALRMNRLRSDSARAGVSFASLCPRELYVLDSLCVSRCQGKALDSEIDAALESAGGASGIESLIAYAYLRLDAAKRALAVYSGQGAVP